MKKVIFGIIIIGLISLAIYLPVVRWIIGITVALIILLFVGLISGSDKREEERMIEKFGKDYKNAIAQGKLGLTHAYPCTPDEYYTSKIEIEEIAKIKLPDFSVKDSKETLKDFTGDYSGEATIEFNEPIGNSVIMQIEEAMKQDLPKWKKMSDNMYECTLSEVNLVQKRVITYRKRQFGDVEYEVPMSEPDMTAPPVSDVFWRISLQKDSFIGKIVYGKV